MPRFIQALATVDEQNAELGLRVMLCRQALGLSEAELAKATALAVEDIERIERGAGSVLDLLRVGQILGFASDIMEACEPRPTTLDELDRVEAARLNPSEGETGEA